MKDFLIGFLLAVVGCIMAFIALITWLYVDYKERKKERKYSDYVNYARYSDSKKKTAMNEVHADHSVQIESQ